MTSLYFAKMETPNFTFEAFGDNPLNAAREMRALWVHHCEQTGVTGPIADPTFKDLEKEFGVTIRKVCAGSKFRDHERCAF